MQSGKAVHILANFHRFWGSVVSIGFRNNFYESRSSSKLPDVHNEEIEHHKSGGESSDLDPGGTIPLPAGLQLQDVDSSLVSSGGQTIPGGHSWGQPRHWPLAGCGGQKQETSQTMSENPALEWNTKFRVARWWWFLWFSMSTSRFCLLLPLFTIRLTTNFTLWFRWQGFQQKSTWCQLLTFAFPFSSSISLFKEEIFSLFHFESKTIEKEQPKHSDSGLDSNREDESFKSVDNSCLESDKVSIDLLTCTNVPVALHKYEKSKSIMPTEYSQKSTEFQK